MTTGSATTPDSAGPARWHDLIPAPDDFALDTVAALFGSTTAAQAAIETALAEGVLDPLDPRSTDDLPRYRVAASHGTLDLHLPTDHEHPAVLRMLKMVLRQLVGVDDRLNPGGYRSADLADLAELGDIPTFPDDAAAARWFADEFATIVATQYLAATMGEDVLVRWFGEVSWAAAKVTGRVPETLPVQTLAAEAAERANHPAASIARARCCRALLELGRRKEALAAAVHAYDLAERYGLAFYRAGALHALGDAYFALGRYGKALTSYRGARRIDVGRVVLAADGSTTPLPMASVGSRWVAIAATHLARNCPGEAVQAALVAVAYIVKDDEERPRELAEAQAMLARALLAHDRAADAIPVLTLAAAALDPAIDRHALAHISELLGDAALATGSPTTEHFRAAAALFEQIGQPDRAHALRDRASAGTPATDPRPTHHDEART